MVNDQWYFSKDDFLCTPSVMEGMTVQQEQMDRTKGCLYLLAIASKLNFTRPQLAVATACTFFHRFFMRQSMQRFHVYDIAATSLFVATKVEECTRRIKDFVNVCAQKAQKNDRLQLTEDSKDFNKWKDTMLCNETILLQTLCFDIAIEHPQACLLDMEKELGLSQACTRRAWIFLYQSLGAPLCLLYKPKTIAAAALVLAWQFSENDQQAPPENWWEVIGVDPGQVYELAVEMLEFDEEHYPRKPSTPHHSSSFHQHSSSQHHQSSSSQSHHSSSQPQQHYQQQHH
ncbi:cyclin-like protein [Phascolomyces articulosus]|uniref:Cyclin-like protein n=1 Tax=Phascolomyces articulosus TaxID=60185 RepID=A0AAD5P7V4_9FUNG|nr:cyclin-like protein [Phascolomyces articulosus]